MDCAAITDALVADTRPLCFEPPVAWVYQPLVYARAPYQEYWDRYGRPPKEVMLLGMNPGPFGMAQTGVPFGDVGMVREWLGIEGTVGRPAREHPKRPVEGFRCPRGEVSGRRLRGWARERFGAPNTFFRRFFVANYCPLLFLDAGGRNLTPDRLRGSDTAPLFDACDRALRRTVDLLGPRVVVGVGRFAEARAREALRDSDVTIVRVAHPSPASPQANRGWAALVERDLRAAGISL